MVPDIWVDEAGDTMTGTLDMSGNDITDVANLTVNRSVILPVTSIRNAYLQTGAVDSRTIMDGSIQAGDLAGLVLNDLTNVNTVPSAGDFLMYGGAAWQTGNSSMINLENLGNVMTGGPANGQVLTYWNNFWTNRALPSAGPLGGLSDVTIGGPVNDQVLTYEGGKWVNRNVSAGGTVDNLDDIGDVDISSNNSRDILMFNPKGEMTGGMWNEISLNAIMLKEFHEVQYAETKWYQDRTIFTWGGINSDGKPSMTNTGKWDGADLWKLNSKWADGMVKQTTPPLGLQVILFQPGATDLEGTFTVISLTDLKVLMNTP